MSIVLRFLVMLASSRFINPCILPNPHPTFPYFFAPLSLKVTYAEAFARSRVRINYSPQFPQVHTYQSLPWINLLIKYVLSTSYIQVLSTFYVPVVLKAL